MYYNDCLSEIGKSQTTVVNLISDYQKSILLVVFSHLKIIFVKQYKMCNLHIIWLQQILSWKHRLFGVGVWKFGLSGLKILSISNFTAKPTNVKKLVSLGYHLSWKHTRSLPCIEMYGKQLFLVCHLFLFNLFSWISYHSIWYLTLLLSNGFLFGKGKWHIF